MLVHLFTQFTLNLTNDSGAVLLEPTWDFMNDIKSREVAEGGSSENTVVVVQRADVHHAQVQQLQNTSQ